MIMDDPLVFNCDEVAEFIGSLGALPANAEETIRALASHVDHMEAGGFTVGRRTSTLPPDYEAVVRLVAALRPDSEWQGKGGAARQKITIVGLTYASAIPAVVFVRTAGVERSALGRQVAAGLDQLLAAFEPCP